VLYHFERFTDTAKRVLTLAQEEAERSRHSYIGTEHLLIGLLRAEEGVGAMILDALGVDLAAVRASISSVLRSNPRVTLKQIIPTSRVKKVIEIAFEEAGRAGSGRVGSEHVLLGLLVEGEGVGAHVLQDLGVTIDRVRERARELEEDGVTEPVHPGGESGVQRLSQPVDELVAGMTELEAVEALARLLERLSAAGPPPEELLQLAGAVRRAEALRRSAVTARDLEAAARHREEEQRLRDAFEHALRAWRRS
jgi:ATP-dependent Clp protease ATP-binding subunit ClpA